MRMSRMAVAAGVVVRPDGAGGGSGTGRSARRTGWWPRAGRPADDDGDRGVPGWRTDPGRNTRRPASRCRRRSPGRTHPPNTQSFVLHFHDAEVARNRTTEDQLHWIVWNIPGDGDGAARRRADGRSSRRQPPAERERRRVSRPRRAGHRSAASLHVRALRARHEARRRRRPPIRSTRGPTCSRRCRGTCSARRSMSGCSSDRSRAVRPPCGRPRCGGAPGAMARAARRTRQGGDAEAGPLSSWRAARSACR